MADLLIPSPGHEVQVHQGAAQHSSDVLTGAQRDGTWKATAVGAVVTSGRFPSSLPRQCPGPGNATSLWHFGSGFLFSRLT